MRSRRPDVTVGLVVAAALLGGACGTAGPADPPVRTATVTATATATAPSLTTMSAPATAASSSTPATSTSGSMPATSTSRSVPATSTSRSAPATSTSTAVGLPAALRGTDLEVMPTTRTVVALTFDCGSDVGGAASVLATLRSTRTPATFFLTGAFTRRYPDLARQLAAGYRIGNHTDDHVALTTLSDAAVRSQITDAELQIRATTGVDPRPWFRFPYGDRDARTIADVNGRGYAAIRWTVDSLGWKGTSGGQSVASVRDRVLAAVRPGAIVLMHLGANPDDGTTLDADALPSIIAGLTARGYTPVHLDLLLD